MNRILLVDDEVNVLNALQRRLHQEQFEVEAFDKPHDALARARDRAFDLVISDYRMPGMTGVAFLNALRVVQPHCVRLILSAYADLSALVEAINEAAIFRFISKPWSDEELLIAIRQGLEHQGLLNENRLLADRMREQQGVISRQQRVLQQLQQAHPALLRVDRDADGAIIYDTGEF